MFAGCDTTAITLRAIFLNLLTHPAAVDKLVAELAAESAAGRFARSEAEAATSLANGGRSEFDGSLVRWSDVRKLPYLGAVINAAIRCHPAAGLPLERIVPTQGLSVGGHQIPAGTIVDCSAWVVHRDEGVYGPA